jgi:hypothetical protein
MWIHLVALAAGTTVNGLYPLWEQTGILHAAGTGQVGYGHAQLGLGGVQFGTQPFLDLYGTPNVQLKAAVVSRGSVQIAAQLGLYQVPVAAASQSIGNLRPVGLVNPYGPVSLVPLSMAASLIATPRLGVHVTATLLVTRSTLTDDRRAVDVSTGQSLLAELWATQRWAARLHVGVDGVGVAGRSHAGLSFAYAGDRLTLQAGYVRWLTLEGESSGSIMFDGALLFR